jgi:hypothetical protein
MPLAGTKREQKHYREIRKEYPEKGKEYAARVARNIVRANTPGGRKLKGTTEYGRTWGPPYSEPLSKESAYDCGIERACLDLGLLKTAAHPLAEWFRRILEGPHGELVARVPVQASMGALGGAAAGQLYSNHPGRGALLGAMTGGLGGLAVASAPRLREALIKRLTRL